MDVYFISGLGADRSVFERLVLPAEYIIHHIDWIQFEKNEQLDSYAKRLSKAIDASQPFVLIGLSLGGMLASEMTDFLQPSKAIIISSAPTAKQLPPWFRWMGRTRLNKLVPLLFYKQRHALLHWLFGIHTREEKELFSYIVLNADPLFVHRAINAVLQWKRETRNKNIVHIHGDADNLLPVRFAKPDITIKGGGHLMVFSKAEEVSLVLNEILGR